MPAFAEIEAAARKDGLGDAEIAALRDRYDPSTGYLAAPSTGRQFSQSDFESQRAAAKLAHPTLAAIGNVAGPALSAGLSYGNTAGLGIPMRAASALTAPFTREEGQSLGDAYSDNQSRANALINTSPAAATAGSIAALIAPTPAKMLMQAGGIAGTTAADVASTLATGGTRLSTMAAETFGPWRTAIGQMISAYAGNAGAIAAIDGAFAVPEIMAGDKTLVEAGKKVYEDFKSPVNLALAGAPGLIGAAIRINPDVAKIASIDNAARRWGFRPGAAAFFPEGSNVQRATDTISQGPLGRTIVADLNEQGFYRPLREDIARMDRSLTTTEPGARKSQAAGAIRTLMDTRQGSPDSFEGQIGQVEARAVQAGGFAQPVSTTLLRGIGHVAEDALTTMQGPLESRGELAGAYHDLLLNPNQAGSFANIVMRTLRGEGGTPTWQLLANVQKRVGDAIRFNTYSENVGGQIKALSDPDKGALNTVYRAIRQAQRNENPVLSNMNNDIHILRELRGSFDPLNEPAVTGDDKQLFDAMLGRKDFPMRWGAYAAIAPTEAVQAARGSYFSDFMNAVSQQHGGENGSLLLRDVRRLWNGSGPYRSEVFNRVLPGFQEDIHDRARISDIFLRTMGRAEGSQTAGRAQDIGVVKVVGKTLGAAVDMFTDPASSSLVWRVLGIGGARSFAASILRGHMRDQLIRLATGQPAISRMGTVGAGVVAQRGGLTGLAQDVTTMGTGAANTGMGALQGLMPGGGAGGLPAPQAPPAPAYDSQQDGEQPPSQETQ